MTHVVEPAVEDSTDPDLLDRPPALDFTAFYRDAYQGTVRALAYTLGDTDLAVDAADEGMARAYLHWDSVRTYDNPGGWVYRVSLNWARSLHRRLSRRLPFRPVTEVSQPPVADPAVAKALRDLDERHRAVVVCRLLLDWSVEDTAEALGVRPGTVKSRLHRALRTLETTLSHMR
jgi:RNA polymerase sigma factor (sigma-70 family)